MINPGTEQSKAMTARTLSLPALWRTFRTQIIGRKFIRNVGILTVANLVGVTLSFVQSILVARWLGPELYGVAALVMSYAVLLFTFLDVRSVDASVKYLGEFLAKGENGRVLAICKLGYTVDISMSLLTFVLVATTAWWAEEHVVHTTGTAWLIVLYAASFLPGSLGRTSSAILVTLGRFPTLAQVEILTAILRTTLVLTLVVGGWGVVGIILGNAIGSTVQGAVLGILAYPAVRQAWGKYWTSGSWRALTGRRWEICRFFFYNDLTVLLDLTVKQFDLVILGYFRGPTEVGYYRLAKSIGATLGNLVGPLQSVISPKFAQLWGAGQQTELKRRVKRCALWIGIPLGLLALASLPLLPMVIEVLVEKEYRPATMAAQLMLARSSIWLALFWLRPMFFTLAYVRFWSITRALVAVFALFGFATVAPKWGCVGMAWVQLLTGSLGNLVALTYLSLRWKTGGELSMKQIIIESWPFPGSKRRGETFGDIP